jgi:TldD protein
VDFERLLELAMSHAQSSGASYADIRFERSLSETVSAEDGKPREASRQFDTGYGIRALAGGAWGFASINGDEDIDRKKLLSAVLAAVKNAKATARISKHRLVLAPSSASGKYETNVKKDPFKVPLEERMALVVDASKRIKDAKSVTLADAHLGFERLVKYFHSTEGASVRQDFTFTLGSSTGIASVNGVTDYYTNTEGGQAGYEAVTRQCDFLELADDTAKKAVQLASAKSPAPAERTVVIDPDAVALVVHEIIGHPSEADRVLGWEAAWAGTTWWADKVGKRIGSEHVTIVSDASVPGYLGSFGFDDEGVRAQKITHLKNGILTDFMQSRETAQVMGAKPNGCMRAVSYCFAPLIRMTNTYMEAGEWDAQELIEDTKSGVYICGNHTPSVDAKRYNFQIKCRIAYEIKDGEIGEPLRAVSITGTSDKFWSSIDAAAKDVQIRPVPNCGKGDPMQTCMVGNGGPHVRAKARVVGLA